MSTVTITIPESVKSELGHFSWVNWSEAAKEEFIKKQKLIGLLDLKESKEEKEFIEWAAKLTREGRKGRYEELKKKRLI